MVEEAKENQMPLLINQSIKGSTSQAIGNLSTTDSIDIDENCEPNISDSSEGKKLRKLTGVQVCSGICLFIGLIMVLALPLLIEMQIVSQAKENVIISSVNEGRWAHFPGETDTQIMRNFTFFKLNNEGEFLFNNQKPIFTELSGYKIQELDDFLDIEYLDNGNLVKVRDWTRFAEWAEGKNLDEEVSILNMGNLGYWSTLKTSRPTLLLQQGLALLFTNLEQSLIPVLIGSGISQQFLQNRSLAISALLSPSGISSDNFDFMWSDPTYGLSDSENLGFWAESATNCFENIGNSFLFSQGSIILKNYFALTDGQIRSLMYKIYSYITTLRKLLLENHYCSQIEMRECTGRYLAVGQMAEGWITSNTPPVSSITPNDTICDSNVTCLGKYPEPYAFANNVFRIEGKQAEQLGYDPKAIIKFPREAVLEWFNYNHSIEEGLNYNTAQNCLLHIGNLDALWEMGTAFDKSLDTTFLEPIRARFKLETPLQALIFWKWIQYMASDFVLQQSGNANLGIANLFTSGFYSQFSLLKDNLQTFLLAKMLNKDIAGTNCNDFFQLGLDEHQNPELINYLCRQYKDIHSEEFGFKMVNICERKYGLEWQQLSSFGVHSLSMETLCDISNVNSIGARLHGFKLDLDKQYDCNSTPNPYCSDYELALIQWQNSTITLNPPILLSQLPKSPSFSTWNNVTKPFQYQYFIQEYLQSQRENFPRYTLPELYTLFTFESLFSTNLIIQKLGEKALDPYFFKYMRYVCIFVSLNGFTITRTVRQFLFGYEDSFLANIKNSYPPFGGDPSVRSIVSFNDLNITQEEADQTIVFKTGKDDYRNAYQYHQINGFKYLVNNYSWFDGNKTVWEWKSPWTENDYFYGTNAKVFAPNQFEADNISILISQVQRYASTFFHNQTEKMSRYGFDVYLAYPSPKIGEVSSVNDKYYQTLPDVFNVSSIYGIPLYVTDNHFGRATEWLQKVDIYNEDKSILFKKMSKYDLSFLIVEPYTGVSFQSCADLQNNYYHQPDELYNYPINTMLPVFSINRSGNLTEDKVHELFADLQIAMTVKSAVVYVGIGLGVIAICVLIFVTIKKRRVANYQPKSSQLGISLQEGEFNSTDSIRKSVMIVDEKEGN